MRNPSPGFGEIEIFNSEHHSKPHYSGQETESMGKFRSRTELNETTKCADLAQTQPTSRLTAELVTGNPYQRRVKEFTKHSAEAFCRL